jgi:hypothetical protein
MLELVQSLWSLVWGVVLSVWDLAWLLLDGCWDLLLLVHTDMPWAEGLLVGLGLAWLLRHRDSHKLPRVVSAPLKLVLDVMDLVWDQIVDVVSDGWRLSVETAEKGVDLGVSLLGKCWNLALAPLRWLQSRLGPPQ